MSQRLIDIPNTNIAYSIIIPDTAADNDVNYRDKIIMTLDDALAQLRSDNEHLTENNLFQKQEIINIKKMWKETIDKNTCLQKAVDTARNVIEMQLQVYLQYEKDKAAKDWLAANPKEIEPNLCEKIVGGRRFAGMRYLPEPPKEE